MSSESEDPILISARELRFGYGKGKLRREVLHGVSADFRKGEITLITGPSGSGKTTFLSLVGALRTVQEGGVRVFGRELSGLKGDRLAEVRRSFGYVFQNHNLIPSLTACENVQMALGCGFKVAARKAREMSLEALQAVGLLEHARHRPGELSGGQLQRVGIARALVRKPRIILADEPTALLDAASGREVVDLLKRLAREQLCTVILVTHDHRILDISDRILTLTDGCLEESHVGFARICGRMKKAFACFSKYLEMASLDQFRTGAFTEQRAFFRQEAQPAEKELAVWSQRSLSEYENERVAVLQRWMADLQGLEASLCDFLEVWENSRELRGAAKLRDSSFQALETLILTCGEQMENPEVEGLAVLKAASQSGGNFSQVYLAGRLRENQELSEVEMRLLLNFTGVLAQSIFFIRSLADCMIQWRELEMAKTEAALRKA